MAKDSRLTKEKKHSQICGTSLFWLVKAEGDKEQERFIANTCKIHIYLHLAAIEPWISYEVSELAHGCYSISLEV